MNDVLPDLPMSHRGARLEPMGVGGIIVSAFALYRNNWRVFVTIAAVIAVPAALLSWVLPFSGDAEIIADSLIQGSLLWPLHSAAVVKAATDLHLGVRPDVASAYRFAEPQVIAVLAASLLVSIASVVGLVLLIIPGIIIMGMWQLAVPAIVLEGLQPARGLERSRTLVKGHLGRSIGVMAAELGITVLIGWPIKVAFDSLGDAGAMIGGIIVTVGILPFVGLVPVLFYFDMRVRKEEFDLTMLAQATGRATPA